jgi:integrase
VSTALDASPVDSATASEPVPRPGKLSRRSPLALSAKKAPVTPLAGSVHIQGEWWTLRVRIDGSHQRITLGKVAEMSEAHAREKGAAWRERMARERRGVAPSTSARGPTFQDVARRWTSGELARDFPDHVKAKRTAERDVQRLDRYVYPIAGRLPIVDFTIDHAEAVMKALPANRVRTPATRRHVAQLMHRILGIAVIPLRLIKVNPLPKGFMPKVGPSKAKGYLYPADDARLPACVDVPLDWRFWYGFLDREGPRTSEAESFTWGDFDLERGAVKLDENKTDDPRAWALSPGVVAALHAMRARRKAAGVPVGSNDPVFILRTDGKKYDPAKLFREHLRIAGINRPELFERSASRMHIRRHDLRATFVTLNLAAGRTETWIADRTGHKSSDMINKYRRAARTAEELNLGELAPLDAAIPELAEVPASSGGSSSTSSGDPADASGTEDATCSYGCAYAELDAANREVDPSETAENSDVSPPSGATLNPLIMVRIHAPEQGDLRDVPASGRRAGHATERWPIESRRLGRM